MSEYDSRVRAALNYFVDEVLLPGDELIIVTPMKTYRMKSELLAAASREKVFEQVLGILRRDILIGNSEYRDNWMSSRVLALAMAGSVGLAAPPRTPRSADGGRYVRGGQRLRCQHHGRGAAPDGTPRPSSAGSRR